MVFIYDDITRHRSHRQVYFLLTHRETDNKAGADLRTGNDLDRAGMSIDDPFGDRQTKAGTAGLAISRFVRPVETFKDMNDI